MSAGHAADNRDRLLGRKITFAGQLACQRPGGRRVVGTLRRMAKHRSRSSRRSLAMSIIDSSCLPTVCVIFVTRELQTVDRIIRATRFVEEPSHPREPKRVRSQLPLGHTPIARRAPRRRVARPVGRDPFLQQSAIRTGVPCGPSSKMLIRREPIAFIVVASIVGQDEVMPEVERIPNPCDEVIDVTRCRSYWPVAVKASATLESI